MASSIQALTASALRRSLPKSWQGSQRARRGAEAISDRAPSQAALPMHRFLQRERWHAHEYCLEGGPTVARIPYRLRPLESRDSAVYAQLRANPAQTLASNIKLIRR